MNWIFPALLILGLGLEAGLMVRGFATQALKKHTLVYSYIGYVLITEIICAFVDRLSPGNYAIVFWFFLTGRTLAEFGVLWGVSDFIFRPYPPLRVLGRVFVGLAIVAFALLYWVPNGWNSQPSSALFLSLMKISALTKAVAIAGILAAARSFRIPLGRNAGGILLGLVAYYSIGVANFAAAAQFGRSVYAGVLAWLIPASFGVCLIIWTVALWQPDPLPVARPSSDGSLGGSRGRPDVQIRRLETYVTRLFWK